MSAPTGKADARLDHSGIRFMAPIRHEHKTTEAALKTLTQTVYLHGARSTTRFMSNGFPAHSALDRSKCSPQII